MKDILGVRRLNSVLVPKDLTFDQKNARKETASLNLEATTDDPELLKRVITGDETWIYGFDSETTQQASEWRFKNEPRLKKARKAPSKVTVMLTVFFDFQGIVHHEFQQQGSTITADSYLGVLRRLREAIRQKRPELWRSKSWILHHDNAPAHTALKISKFLQDHSTSVFPQPPYSPDLAPCDFFLFRKLEKKEIKVESKMAMKAIPKTDYQRCFADWKKRWLKCIAANGDYFERDSLNLIEEELKEMSLLRFWFLWCRLDPDCVARFTLTVRKNYRRVPYHNWGHGFAVANAGYAFINACPQIFNELERMSLFVACLCHDLDHRGQTNQFLAATDSPLAAIYTTSTLEHHHFNMTVSILQQEGHNIFKNLSSEDYKEVNPEQRSIVQFVDCWTVQALRSIKRCILATDLANFFPARTKLTELLDTGRLDWTDHEQRLSIESLSMTACDLCASTKPWSYQQETVKIIFEEFYAQGDAEKLQGKTPVPMMDRDKQHEQPMLQVGFLKGLCVPCFELLHRLIPETEPLLEGC
ncbi:hypothetical protein LAZ67_17002900, partial [Cordylochernes scorpioides]